LRNCAWPGVYKLNIEEAPTSPGRSKPTPLFFAEILICWHIGADEFPAAQVVLKVETWYHIRHGRGPGTGISDRYR